MWALWGTILVFSHPKTCTAAPHTGLCFSGRRSCLTGQVPEQKEGLGRQSWLVPAPLSQTPWQHAAGCQMSKRGKKKALLDYEQWTLRQQGSRGPLLSSVLPLGMAQTCSGPPGHICSTVRLWGVRGREVPPRLRNTVYGHLAPRLLPGLV